MGTDFEIAKHDIDIGFYNESEHYSQLCSFWEAHGVEVPLAEDLPGLHHGMIATDDSGLLGACFLYVSGPIGFVEALVTCPGLSIRKARKVSDRLHETIRYAAKRAQVKKLVAFVSSKGMVRECDRVGFSQKGAPMIQMTQSL